MLLNQVAERSNPVSITGCFLNNCHTIFIVQCEFSTCQRFTSFIFLSHLYTIDIPMCIAVCTLVADSNRRFLLFNIICSQDSIIREDCSVSRNCWEINTVADIEAFISTDMSHVNGKGALVSRKINRVVSCHILALLA